MKILRALIGVVMFLSAVDIWAQAWPQYGRDLCNTHSQTGKGEMIDSASVMIKWSCGVGGMQQYNAPVLADLNGDGYLNVIFIGGSNLFVVDNEGVLFWSYAIGASTFDREVSPAVADIDGDSLPEVVAGGGNYVYAFNDDGSVLWTYQAFLFSSPVIADMEGDGLSEVIFGSRGKVFVLTCCDSLPFISLKWSFETDTTGTSTCCSPAVADMNGDTTLEIVFGDDNAIYSVDMSGDLLWSYAVSGKKFSPVLADLNGDTLPDIIFGSGNTVYALSNNGVLLWSNMIGTIGTPPAVADIDKDGKVEIVIIAGSGNNMYCLNNNGIIKWQSNTSFTRFSPSIGDIDNDSYLEVLALHAYPDTQCTNDSIVCCVNHDGSLNWSRSHLECCNGNPVLGDIDGDGNLEIAIASGPSEYYILVLDNLTDSLKGNISGTVWDSTGPIIGAYVHVFDSAGFNEGHAYTGDSGAYIIYNLEPNKYYVEASASGYAGEFYDNTTDFSSATPIEIIANQNVSNISFVLTAVDTDTVAQHYISGQIVNSQTGNPINCVVIALKSDSEFYPVTTNSSGKYVINSLDSIPHYLYAWAPGYIGEYYDTALTWEAATEVTPTVDDVDFALAPATKGGTARICGEITSNTGNPLGEVMVYAMESKGGAVGCAKTWANGKYIIDKLPAGSYTIRASIPFRVTTDYSTTVTVSQDTVSDIDIVLNKSAVEDKIIEKKDRLSITSANPSVRKVDISYSLSNATQVSLGIYNATGRLVRTLVNSQQKANTYIIGWDGKDDSGRKISSGMYFCKLKAGEFKSVKKIVLIK